jgi:O-antigen/teichoic acid export membrane protein
VSTSISGARSAAITTAALALSSGLNFLAIFVWVRVLGPHEFGVYALVSGAGLFLNSMLFEWMRGVGSRTLYDRAAAHHINPARADAILRYGAMVALGFTLVAAILWACNVDGPGFGASWLPLIVAFTISEMALAILNVTSRIRMLPWQFFIALVARSGLAIVIGLGLVIGLRMGAVGVMLGIVLAQLGTAVVIMVRDPMWRSLRLGRASRADATARAEVLALGRPLVLSTALTYGSGIADRYLVDSVLGTSMVGYYTGPVDMLQKTMGFLMLALNIAAYPAMVRAYDDHGPAAARKVLEDNFVAQLMLGLPAVVAFSVIPSGISNLLLGKAYHDAAVTLLPWVSVAALLRLLISNHLVMVFQLERRMKLMLVAPIVSVAVLVPAGIWGMRAAGLPGMAYASLASQTAAWIVCAVLARRIFTFSLINRDVVKIGIASAIMGAALYPMRAVTAPGMVMLICAAGGAVFALAILALRLERAAPIMAKITGRLKRR